MPYSNPSDLPETIRRSLPTRAQRVFMAAYNAAMGDDEERMRRAWGAVKRGWKKDTQGRWVRKSQPAVSDVHVPSTRRKKVKKNLRTGSHVQWQSSGGLAHGIIRSVHRDGTVPNIPVKITASEDEPAARIQLMNDDGSMRDEYVGHKLSTLEIRKAEGFKAPESARNNAKKVLRWREEHGDAVKGMTRVGWTRASQLASNETLSLETVKRMAQFNRHRKNAEVAPEYKNEPWRDAGYVAWLGWGGTSGIEWAKRIAEREMNKSETIIEITKADDELQVVYGWASVIGDEGNWVQDSQGDIIKLDTLRKGAHDFMMNARHAGEMHKRVRGVGTVVESLIVTPEIRKTLGMEDGPTGWFIGMKITDDEVWKKVKAGEYQAFSIGGRGTRTEL